IEVEHAAAASAIQWFNDHLAAEFRHKLLKPLHITAHESLWDLFRETQRVEFFVGLPQSSGVIHHKTFFLVHQTEKMSGKEKFHVERRILAHEDDVKVLESSGFEFPQSIMGHPASDMNSTRTPIGDPTADEQVIDLNVIDS